MLPTSLLSYFFFFNDTATTEIYTLSLHDALPILHNLALQLNSWGHPTTVVTSNMGDYPDAPFVRRVGTSRVIYSRSEEHTSELQSRSDLVCRLLLEKKKRITPTRQIPRATPL